MLNLAIANGARCVLTGAIVMLVSPSTSTSALDRTHQIPAFEVASVKLNKSGSDRGSWHISASPLIMITNMPLHTIVAEAYGISASLERFVLKGGTREILSARFDINAKRPDGAPADQNKAMLRTLLAERFGLRSRTERQSTPVFALSLARSDRLGPQLARSAYSCDEVRRRRTNLSDPISAADLQTVCFKGYTFQPGAMTVRSSGLITELITRIQGFVERPVIDATGLTGNFEWELTFALRDNADIPGVSTALDEQLGLKLQRSNSELDVLVIDSVSWPTPD